MICQVPVLFCQLPVHVPGVDNNNVDKHCDHHQQRSNQADSRIDDEIGKAQLDQAVKQFNPGVLPSLLQVGLKAVIGGHPYGAQSQADAGKNGRRHDV